ncbi:SymE family type I addiction module toxin [Undibacterium sp. SXout11W]|uniref:SymE family type I addiction module toxin n=1 Tax=Undibacterium sp. SXout11W TaxID=3413050 RepID=UPI003BF2A0B9
MLSLTNHLTVWGSMMSLPKSKFKHERFLTVSLCPQPRPRLPWIRLCGLWLLDAGFTPKTRVRVRVMKDCLVITREEIQSHTVT